MKPDFCLLFSTTSPHYFSGLSSEIIIRAIAFIEHLPRAKYSTRYCHVMSSFNVYRPASEGGTDSLSPPYRQTA